MSAGHGHSQPFYCAYCGEETIEPIGDAGGWWCSSCLRAFTLRFAGTGVAARDALVSPAGPVSATGHVRAAGHVSAAREGRS